MFGLHFRKRKNYSKRRSSFVLKRKLMKINNNRSHSFSVKILLNDVN